MTLNEAIASGAGALLAFLLRFAWDRFVRRADANATALESDREERAAKLEHRLDAMAATMGAVQAQLGVLLERLAFNAAEFRRLDERQAGMSTNHGQRLAHLEAKLVRLETLWESLHGGGAQ